MSKMTITISLDPEFADKFLGMLKNLITVNGDKKKLNIDCVTIDDNVVAYPKENYDSTV